MASVKKDIKVTKTAINDLKEYVGLAEYDRKYERSPGTYVDITLLKRAILYIQNERPEAKSFRITSIDTNSLPFLLVETKDQDTDGERKSAFVISPLTTHVDRAEKFADVSMEIYMQPETDAAENQSSGKTAANMFSDIATEIDKSPVDSGDAPKKREGSAFSGIDVAGSNPPAKPKRAKRKAASGDEIGTS